MIWAGELTFALALCWLSWLARDRALIGASLVFAAGIAAMQIFKHGLPPDFVWLGASGIWVLGGYVVARRGHLPQVAALLVASGLCYFYGRMSGQSFGKGSPALFWADVFGIAAMLSVGWRVGWVHLRNWRLVGSSRAGG